MEEQQQPEDNSGDQAPGGCLIALYMIPVFFAIGVGMLYMSQRMDPTTIKMSEAESSAFETNMPAADEVLLSTDPAVRAVQLAQSTPTPTQASPSNIITMENLEKMVGKPVSLRKLLNSIDAVDAVLAQPEVMAVLKSKSRLQSFIAASPEIGLFIFSPAITALSADRRSLDAALSSQFVGRIGNASGVQALLHDQPALLKAVKANAQLAEFLKQQDVSDAIEAFSKSGVLEGLDTPAVAELIGKAKPAAKSGSGRR
ncbi:MAG TPA: hypothetical protein PLL10_03225 [Elusimicrobiales bacterium]|nr:hypothetical protein [Elusimicrobiales bacterium]